MAENKIVNISKNSLPIDADTGEYVFRYRVISDDKNRFSAWSPVYRILAPTIAQTLYNNGLSIATIPQPTFSVQTIGTDKVATVYWNTLDVFKDVEKYDVYIKWDGDYEYFKTMPAGSFSIVKPADKAAITTISMKIQSVTYPKKLIANDQQVLYTLTNKTF